MQELGEPIKLYKSSFDNDSKAYDLLPPTVYDLSASILPATKAAYNIIDREYLFTGSMTLPIGVDANHLRGSYLTRDIMTGFNYLLFSIIGEPISSTSLATVYLAQCNERVTIQKKSSGPNKYGDIVETWVDYVTVDSYFGETLRSRKETQDGSFDDSIYSIIIPAKHMVSTDMRILKTSFINGKVGLSVYSVESIDTSLIDINSDTGEIYGVLHCQLKKDSAVA